MLKDKFVIIVITPKETQDELYLFDINETSFFEGIKSIIFNMD